MLHLLHIIIPFGALTALLMPSSIIGLIITAVLFSLITGIILHARSHNVSIEKGKGFSLLLPSIISAVYLGFAFVNRWLNEPKALAVANILNVSLETLLLFIALVLVIPSSFFIYTSLQIISKKLSSNKQNNHPVIGLLLCLLFSIGVVALVQIMSDTAILSMGYSNYAWGTLIVFATVLFLYCLFGKIIPSITLGTGIFMLLSTINVYVYRFRIRLFEPIDIFSAGTALSVLGNYSLFPLSRSFLFSWGLFVIGVIALSCLQYKIEHRPTLSRRFILLTLCIISSVSVAFYATDLQTRHWYKEGLEFHGYILDFASKFKEISVPKPDNYSADLITQIENQYAPNHSKCKEAPSEPPHIIVIMDESFSDLSIFGEFSTSTKVTPFISSLKENTLSGYALTSVFGGNTANSEYEFLTGNTMAWLSPNVVPFQQYIRSSTYSMVSHLKSLYNYKCIAMHPYHASSWNRPAAYKHLGFDECYFSPSFPQEDLIRSYISDRGMFDFLIETYESQKDQPLFIFGVTMQNHGGYYYVGDNYTHHISLNDYTGKYPDVEQYLSLLHETDKAVERLITYFQSVNEDVVILFFGDHQPKINESFYQVIGQTSATTLDQQQKRYMIPFFIWTNYDIEEKCIDCTSLNYLSSYLYDAAGIALPPYNRFLQEMESNIPAINANSFYSSSHECYLPFDQADGEELKWLNLYKSLQYNNIFDKSHRSEILFPVLQ